MKRFAKLFLWIAKSRYNLTIKDLPKLNPNYNYLILPNHIAYIDPVFIWSILAPQRELKTVATARFSENFFLKRIFKQMGTISVAEMLSEKKDLNKNNQAIKESFKKLIVSLHS